MRRSLPLQLLLVSSGVSDDLAQDVISPPGHDRWMEDVPDEAADYSCARCQSILTLLKGVAALGDDVFVSAMQEVCRYTEVEDDDVCDGAIALEGPIIADAVRGIVPGSRTAAQFCITFLGLCDYPPVEEWDVPFPSEKPETVPTALSGSDPVKVVHFSDIHIDPLYTQGANAVCTKPICCRPYTEDDEPGNSASPAGPNGNHACDVPVSLEESMYAAIKELVPDAAFVVFTGDMVDHSVWNTTQEYNEEGITNAYTMMNKYLPLVYGTAGNHEAHPTNAFEPTAAGPSAQWIYDVLSSQWSRWIGTAVTDAEKSGSYSAKFPEGALRIISLNTNMYYRQNYYLYQDPMERDPNGQIEWLVSELDAAERAGDKAYIIGHMPLGDHNAFHDGSNHLDQVVRRYEGTIAAMFFGHTHMDQFQISYADYEERSYANALVTSYIGPSLTPTSGMPSFRVYDVDPETFAVLDATTYSADMRNPAFQRRGPVWKKYYSAKETYGPLVSPPLPKDSATELSAAFWHNLTVVFEEDREAMDGYRLRKSRDWLRQECDEECRALEICQLRAARSQDNCWEPEAGVHFLSTERAKRDECGFSVSREAMGGLTRREVLEVLERVVAEMHGGLS